MSKKKSKEKTKDSNIAQNKKAFFSYFLEQKIEAGLVLEGWEVKSIRAGKAQISEAHVVVKQGEAYLLNSVISPLPEASKHTSPKNTRTRKLLLNRKELDKLIGSIERQGYTIVPVNMYWKKNCIKLQIALAKGKKLHDKRQTEKERDWNREKARVLKSTR